MDSVEKKHWWYKSLHRLVLYQIKQKTKSTTINILDAGCGTGGLLFFLKEEKYINLVGFDVSKKAVSIAKNKNLNVEQADMKKYKINPNKYDVIISNDTLYFFNEEEQKNILHKFYHSLNSDGIVILNMPSIEAFKGIHDKVVGANIRFNKKMIMDIVDTNKYTIIQQLYWPFLLSPIIFIIRLMQRIKLQTGLVKNMKSDIDMPSRFINYILFQIVKFENNFIKNKPFGSSLFLVLKKNND